MTTRIDAKSVLIAVATYHRPLQLDRLLNSLRRDPSVKGATILIVDNSPTAEAAQIVSAVDRWPEYLHEPRPGIAAARNAALRYAFENSFDWIAFVDDDEEVLPGWLLELLDVASEMQADAVTGPCVPKPEIDADPAWARDPIFAYGGIKDRTRVTRCSTGNVILRLASVLKLDEPQFNDGYGITGGSDSELFERLTAIGARLYWAQSARVIDWIPASRTNPKWIEQRLIRYGSVDARIMKEVHLRSTLFVLAQGLVRIVRGWPSHVISGISRGGSSQNSATYLRGVGMLRVVGGVVSEEYARR